MANSPYKDKPITEWNNITLQLLNDYPLSLTEVGEIAHLAWGRLWSSSIGGEIQINEVDLPATVVGYFFQKLFAHELSSRYPNDWSGEKLKRDKDLVNLKNVKYSTEMKASGQLGYSLYGNRSYNQESETGQKAGKTKSGYYITLNFFKQTITLIRLGWIDQDDWIPQGSETGQAAVLHQDVYKHKLVKIPGDYIKIGPLELLDGVGGVTATKIKSLGLNTINDVLTYTGSDKTVLRIKNKNIQFLDTI